MEFTSELSIFQGVILSADNIHSFSKITSRGGNEDKILDIITSIYKFLQNAEYVTENSVNENKKSEMRKFCYYLVLNSDFPILEEMVEMPNIELVINTIPTITKCLICDMIWGLNMDIFLSEIISFCNPLLSLQILNAFTDSIKHFTPDKALSKISLLSESCYILLLRLQYYNFDNNLKIAAEVYDYFLRCINYFIIPPNDHKLNSLNEDNLYKYKGTNLLTLLNLIQSCFAHFTSDKVSETDVYEELYVCTFKPENIKTRQLNQAEISDVNILDYVQKCNIALLDKGKTLVMEISVDIFCAWSEFDDNGKNMQQSIGEVCHIFHSQACNRKDIFDHPFIDMLPQISSKPVDVHDVIKGADEVALIENANKHTEDKIHWLRAITQRNFWENAKLIECILDNITSFEVDECEKIFRKIIIYLNNESHDNIKALAVKAFSQCDNCKRQELVKEHFSNNTFHNTLESNEFDNMTIEIFNKLIALSDYNFADIYCVFIQNPYEVYFKILNTAIENEKQSDIMVKVIEMLKEFSNYYYKIDTSPCIVKAIETFSNKKLESDVHQSSYVNFLTKIKNCNVLEGVKLMLLLIMPNLHKALLNKDLSSIKLQVKMLRSAYTVEELLQYRAPVLAMLSQILDVVRWNINTFSCIAPATLEDTLQLQIMMFNTYETDIPENESTWLKNKLKNSKSLNIYYYRKLWDIVCDNYIEVISGQKDLQNNNLLMLLVKILPSLTTREWSVVWDSLNEYGDMIKLQKIYDALTLIIAAECGNRSENSRECILYCYTNFIVTTKNNFLKEPLSDSQVEAVLDKVITIVNLTKVEDIEQTTTIFLPLLSYIAERNSDYIFDFTYMSNKIKHTHFATTVNKLFTNGTV